MKRIFTFYKPFFFTTFVWKLFLFDKVYELWRRIAILRGGLQGYGKFLSNIILRGLLLWSSQLVSAVLFIIMRIQFNGDGESLILKLNSINSKRIIFLYEHFFFFYIQLFLWQFSCGNLSIPKGDGFAFISCL